MEVAKASPRQRYMQLVVKWQPDIDHVGYNTLDIIYVWITVCVQRNPRMWRIPRYSAEKVTQRLALYLAVFRFNFGPNEVPCTFDRGIHWFT